MKRYRVDITIIRETKRIVKAKSHADAEKKVRALLKGRAIFLRLKDMRLESFSE